jgi:hypothetical protein
LLAAGLAALLFLVFVSLPLAGALGLPFAAVPAVRTVHRRGPRAGILVALLSSALILVAGGALAPADAAPGALVAFGVAALPAAAAILTRRGVDAGRAYLLVAAAGALVGGLGLAGAGASLATEVSRTYDQVIPAALESYSRSGMDASSVARVRATLERAHAFTRDHLAGLLASFWVLVSAVACYAGARAARPAPSAEETRFERLRLPAAAVILFVASGLVFALGPGSGRRLGGNVLLPLATLFFVVGLSIICHFARKWFPVGFLRIGLYVLAAYFLNVIVALLGLFDWFVDFRRRGGGGQKA